MKVNTPRFTSKSWIAFPALRGAYKHVQVRNLHTLKLTSQSTEITISPRLVLGGKE